MSSCSLGVNVFRPGIQAAAHHFFAARRCSRLLSAAPIPSRCLSHWPASGQQHRRPPPPQRGGGHGRNNAAAGLVLASIARSVLPRPRGIRTFFGGNRIITHYVDLPPDYEDKEGLPFAKRDLTDEQVC
ncbi:hypothetical protein VTH06DRAFT_4273 [Thermothelomyces fergusii]